MSTGTCDSRDATVPRLVPSSQVADSWRKKSKRQELSRLAFRVILSRPGDPRLVDAQDRIRDAEQRVTEIDNELATLDGDLIDEAEVTVALADFDAVWGCLVPREQARVIALLVERVAYDGNGGQLSITFRPGGIKTLASEMTKRKEDAA